MAYSIPIAPPVYTETFLPSADIGRLVPDRQNSPSDGPSRRGFFTGLCDYVTRQTPPGFPPHSLTIKVNAVYHLLRNFSIDRGLVKNAQVLIVGIGSRIITVKILHGLGGVNDVDEEDIFIPRISFTMVLAISVAEAQ
ncbi:hypothetical protein B0H21DRAFT_712928 [Amylocystis lapponica]|nr:hypothetical protein B0H21DRAFT_712928 [Amylocystis lapponica]